MDQMKKQRLVGGAVLAALLLILVPMVLDFSREEENADLNVVVPSAPDPKKMEVLPLDVWSEPRTPEVEREIVVEPAPIAEPVPAKQPAASPAPSAVAQPAKVAPSPKPSEPVQARTDKSSSIDSGWVVQVVSVSEEAKAIKFRDELRTKGYKAFVVKGGSSSGRSVYRVRVGPELLRSKADQLKIKLRQDTKLEGLVMKYP